MKGKQKSRTPTPSRDTRKRRNSHDHEGVELGGGYVRPTRMCDVPVMNIVAAIGGDDALNADLLESFKDAVSVESILETLGSFFAFVLRTTRWSCSGRGPLRRRSFARTSTPCPRNNA
jgi:hypothetical protein